MVSSMSVSFCGLSVARCLDHLLVSEYWVWAFAGKVLTGPVAIGLCGSFWVESSCVVRKLQRGFPCAVLPGDLLSGFGCCAWWLLCR